MSVASLIVFLIGLTMLTFYYRFKDRSENRMKAHDKEEEKREQVVV